jgi:hypothetical protein
MVQGAHARAETLGGKAGPMNYDDHGRPVATADFDYDLADDERGSAPDRTDAEAILGAIAEIALAGHSDAVTTKIFSVLVLSGRVTKPQAARASGVSVRTIERTVKSLSSQIYR